MAVKPLLLVLTPSLRMAGGNKEILRLVHEIAADGETDVVLASMWRHRDELDTGALRVVHLLQAEPVAKRAAIQLPRIVRAFRRLVAQLQAVHGRRVSVMLTHYATYPLGWAAPSVPRICFNQDMEWLFVRPGMGRSLLKRAILATNRKSAVITTNAYVTGMYIREGVQPLGEASIWADSVWLAPGLPAERDIDVLMLVRGSAIKRLDLYLEALAFARSRTGLRVAAITPDADVAQLLKGTGAELHQRPTDQDLQRLYRRARVFLLLSDVEGFGLPPLEAMGSGCIPACRDSGGVRCYMQGQFADLLFPLQAPVGDIMEALVHRLETGALPEPHGAQEAFREGLDASTASRTNCIRQVQQLLHSHLSTATRRHE